MSLPKEDILNYRKKELLDTITMTMAGRIAEEIISGDISTGAGGDIQQATNMARAMVCPIWHGVRTSAWCNMSRTMSFSSDAT